MAAISASSRSGPGELDPTILSQCSTFFAMRLANEQDQAIIRSAIADSSASTLAFLSSMGQREAIAFGEGVATTMRLKFERLDAKLIPGTAKRDEAQSAAGNGDDVDLIAIVERLRNVPKPQSEPGLRGAGQCAASAGRPGLPQAGCRRAKISSPAEEDLDFGYGLKPIHLRLAPA